MKHKDLPDRWQSKIAAYLEQRGESRKQLNAYDFFPDRSIELKFEDRSTAYFKYAFVITAPEFNELLLVTEHCGYHIFSLGGTSFNTITEE